LADIVGTTLNHYKVESKLAQGGMGEVYIAEDTRLKRSVALKTLPPGMALDPERHSRFEREAQVIASLNHPNIVTIHSVEEANGVHFLTMELVEGKTLSAVIGKEGLPLRSILDLAIPLADAVGAAHQQGITHRDLKPDNVMVGDGDRIKVLDFGLAKLHEGPSGPDDGTSDATAALTKEGKILGTVAYMSPEQAEAKPVNPGSDVFSLGVILYEMATGKQPFRGETLISTITSILRDTPVSVTELNQRLPRHLGRIIKRCLAKDPTTALELRNELEVLRDELASGELQAPVGGPGAAAPRASSRLGWLAAAGAVVVFGALALFGWMRPGGGTAPAVTAPLQATFTQLTDQGGMELRPTLSPDGRYMAYAAADPSGVLNIYLQRVGGRNPINLTEGATADNYDPAYSPDGEFIAFRSDRQDGGVFVMGATGEAVRRLTDFGFNPAWSPDGKEIVFGTEGVFLPLARNSQSSLWVADVATGETRKIYDGDAVEPAWSPAGHRIAFWATPVGGTGSGQRDLLTVRADGSDPVQVMDDIPVDWSPAWSQDGGHLYFSSDRGGSMNLWRVPIDESSGETLGPPEPITTPSPWSGPIAVSGDGRQIAFTALDQRANILRLDFDPRTGKTTSAPTPVTRGTTVVQEFDVAPDGEWIVFRSFGRQEDLYLVRPDGTGLRKLTDDLDKDRGPKFSPDGSRIAFYSNRGGRYEIWTVRPDGSDLRQLTETTVGASVWFPIWSPDGTRLAAYNSEGTYIFDLQPEGLLRKEEAEHLAPRGDDGARFAATAWSPDGRRLAGYAIREDGRAIPDVSVYSFDSGSFTVVGSTLRSGEWLDDRRLVAIGDDSIVLLDIESGETRELAGEVQGLTQVRVGADRRTLFALTSTSESDIWLARLD